MTVWFSAADGRIFLTGFVFFFTLGILYFIFYDLIIKGYRKGPLFGRAIFGAGLFYFFSCLIFVVAYGANHAGELYDENGSILRGAIRENFTLGLFVALKDVGTPLGVALGFLSLAWGRFLDITLSAHKNDAVADSITNLSKQVSELSERIDERQ